MLASKEISMITQTPTLRLRLQPVIPFILQESVQLQSIISTPRLPPEEALDKGSIQPLAPELPNPLLPRLYDASIVRNPMEESETEMVCGAPFDRDPRHLQVNDDWGRDPSGQLRELEISKAGVTLLPRHEDVRTDSEHTVVKHTCCLLNSSACEIQGKDHIQSFSITSKHFYSIQFLLLKAL